MKIGLIITVVLSSTLAAQQGYTPARYSSGIPPALPALVVGGGQAFVELTVGPNGAVDRVAPLRSTPPFTQAVLAAVNGWRFTAARDETIDVDGKAKGPRPVASRVLVAALFRAPTLLTPTLGERPADVAAASPAVAFPTSTREPPYPPQAASGGVVLIEAMVDRTGKVADARVISSAPPFDQPALEAARQWRFRPAVVNGRPTPAYVYLIFGSPTPVTGAR
jgi:TonB family protein